MPQQLKEINGNSTLINISQRTISVKKETEVANSQTEDEILYGQHFVNKQITFGSCRAKGTNTKKKGTCNFTSSDGRYSRRTSQTACCICSCKFHHTNECPYSKTNNNKRQTTENMVLLNEYKNNYHTNNTTKTCEEIANIVLLNQKKLDNSTSLGQTINFAILECGKKWLDCFLETLSKKAKKIPTHLVGTKTFKFRDGVKSKSLKTVILPGVITEMDVKIISDVVDAEIPLLLSKKTMKRE